MKARIFYILIFQPIGAFVFWLFCGFHGKLAHQMNEDKMTRNIVVGMLTIGLLGLLIGFLKYYL